MVGSKRERPWSKKVRCYSREGSVDECIRARVSITEEDLARFCLSWRGWTSVEASGGF